MEIKLIKSHTGYNDGYCEDNTFTLGEVKAAGNTGSLFITTPLDLMEGSERTGTGLYVIEQLKRDEALYNAVAKKQSYVTVVYSGVYTFDIVCVPDYITTYLKKEYTVETPPDGVEVNTLLHKIYPEIFLPSGKVDMLSLASMADKCNEKSDVNSEDEVELHRFIRNLTVRIHNSLKDGDMSFHDGYSLLVAKYLYRVQNVSTYDSTLDFEVYNDNYTVKVDIGDLTAVKVTVVNNLDRSNTTVLTTSEKLLNWIPLGI